MRGHDSTHDSPLPPVLGGGVIPGNVAIWTPCPQQSGGAEGCVGSQSQQQPDQGGGHRATSESVSPEQVGAWGRSVSGVPGPAPPAVREGTHSFPRPLCWRAGTCLHCPDSRPKSGMPDLGGESSTFWNSCSRGPHPLPPGGPEGPGAGRERSPIRTSGKDVLPVSSVSPARGPPCANSTRPCPLKPSPSCGDRESQTEEARQVTPRGAVPHPGPPNLSHSPGAQCGP